MIKVALTVLCLYTVHCLTTGTPVSKINESRPRVRRIVNGYPTDITEHPYMVSLRIRGRNKHYCGGTIVNKKTILTAAHCLTNKTETNLTVKVGSSYSDDRGRVPHNVTKFIIHENYESKPFLLNDIALIILKEPIEIDNITTRSVKLANHNVNVSDGDEATVIGWGLIGWSLLIEKLNQTAEIDGEQSRIEDFERIMRLFPDTLRATQVRMISRKKCDEYKIGNLDGRLCSMTLAGGNFCDGDSGGPLMKGGYQIGIMSEGDEQCSDILPYTYSGIATYREWIHDKVKTSLRRNSKGRGRQASNETLTT
ncbi:hypothetical protein QAD02_000292 [Eretmocerus hayati]|uniref:Uncharacterized protein n=1 Tax=Eretmocerus hayati TaxID=131215 RepID=A0ACC2NE29_9HYME|nr:hypothetical protein QAD02_000292 [Eretmocerus hayati]